MDINLNLQKQLKDLYSFWHSLEMANHSQVKQEILKI